MQHKNSEDLTTNTSQNQNNNNNNANNGNNDPFEIAGADEWEVPAFENITDRIATACDHLNSQDKERRELGLSQLLELVEHKTFNVDLNDILLPVNNTQLPIVAYFASYAKKPIALQMVLSNKKLQLNPNIEMSTKNMLTGIAEKKPLIRMICDSSKPVDQFISAVLIKNGIEIEADDGETIFSAAMNGHYDVLEHCLKKYPSLANEIIDVGDTDEAAPLLFFVATRRSDLDKVRMINLLLKYGANIDELCKVKDPESQEIVQETVLSLLCDQLLPDSDPKLLKLIEFLIERKADFNFRNTNGVTPFQLACIAQQNELVKYMISKGALVNEVFPSVSAFPLTPLFIACETNNTSLFKMLLQLGANVDYAPNGKTLLHFACRYRKVDFLPYLIEAFNFDANLQSQDGSTPLLEVCTGNSYFPQREEVIKLLISHNANVNQRRRDGKTPLIWAIEQRANSIAELLLTNGADANQIVDGITPLEVALTLISYNVQQSKPLDMISLLLLLKYGAKPTREQSEKIFDLACETKNLTLIQQILHTNKEVIDNPLPNNETFLTQAIKKGDADIVREVIAAGANIHVATSEGISPIAVACREGVSLAIVECLLENGALPSSTDQSKISAFLYALLVGNTEILHRLITHDLFGAILEACKTDNTILLKAVMKVGLQTDSPIIENFIMQFAALAAINGSENVLEFFFAHGLISDITVDENNLPLLYLAAESRKQNIVKILLAEGAAIDKSCSADGETALHVACKKGYLEVVDLLLSKGAEKFKQSKDKSTPLSLAFHHNHLSVVDRLCTDKRNSHVFIMKSMLLACEQGDLALLRYLHQHHIGDLGLDFALHNGMTLLHLACQYGHTQIVEWLLAQEVAVDYQNTAGETPLYLACANQQANPEIVKLLLKKGAEVDKKNSVTNMTPREVVATRGEQNILALLDEPKSQLEVLLTQDDFQTSALEYINENNLSKIGMTSFLTKIVYDQSVDTQNLFERFAKILPNVEEIKRLIIQNQIKGLTNAAIESLSREGKKEDVEAQPAQEPQETKKVVENRTAISGWEVNNNNNTTTSYTGLSFLVKEKNLGTSRQIAEETKRIAKEKREQEKAEEKARKRTPASGSASEEIYTWNDGDITSEMPEIIPLRNSIPKFKLKFYCPDDLIPSKYKDKFKFNETSVKTIGDVGGIGIKSIDSLGTIDLQIGEGKKYTDLEVKYEFKIREEYRLLLVKLPADDNTGGVLYAAFYFTEALHTQEVVEKLKGLFKQVDNKNRIFKISAPKLAPAPEPEAPEPKPSSTGSTTKGP